MPLILLTSLISPDFHHIPQLKINPLLGLWYSTKRNETKQLVIDETKRNETIGIRRNETIFDLRKKW